MRPNFLSKLGVALKLTLFFLMKVPRFAKLTFSWDLMADRVARNKQLRRTCTSFKGISVLSWMDTEILLFDESLECPLPVQFSIHWVDGGSNGGEGNDSSLMEGLNEKLMRAFVCSLFVHLPSLSR